ncbi:MAG TPA: hypothetical protein VEW48_24555 [Thermoanaerobaculia bacterium]|nr:hypothetical protein [Thermoanaerobaculia bacterium]
MEQRDLEGFWAVPWQPGAVWQVDLFLLPLWVKAEEGSAPRLEMVWAALCLDLPTGEIAMSRVADAPEGGLAVDALPELARRTGYRPERIQTTDLEVAGKIRTALSDGSGRAAAEVELREDRFELRAVFHAFAGQIAGSDTTTYLGALSRCAVTLHQAGRFAEAVEPLRELLRLDKLDGVKARYLLADSYLHLQRHEDLQELLGHYRDKSAFWIWPRVLLSFRREGDSPAVRELLDEAVRANPFVIRALLEPASAPIELPAGLVGTGSAEEAQAYAAAGRTTWEATPGALEWLAARATEKGRKKK